MSYDAVYGDLKYDFFFVCAKSSFVREELLSFSLYLDDCYTTDIAVQVFLAHVWRLV